MKSKLSKNWIELFPENDIPIIIQDVQNACRELKRPSENEKRPEENLSKQLFKMLRVLPRYRKGPLEPHIESWLPDMDGRADIRFSCGKGIDTYFILEAKRLFVTYPSGIKDSLIKKYIDEGMMRFVLGRYAPFQKASAMLAYIFDTDIPTAKKALCNAIKNAETTLRLKIPFSKSSIPVTPSIEETIHELEKKRDFSLYHLFVRIK